jgi:hypothetical protein
MGSWGRGVRGTGRVVGRLVGRAGGGRQASRMRRSGCRLLRAAPLGKGSISSPNRPGWQESCRDVGLGAAEPKGR